MKTGDLKDEDSKAPKNDVATLTEIVLGLQKELKEYKQNSAPPGSNVDLVKALAEFSAAQRNAENVDFQAGISVEQIPEDDYDEKGITFCAPFTGYAIADDRRKGHRVVLPYNKPYIVFEYQGGKPIQDGKHTKLMNLCTYTSNSKKEIAWLREYSFFNSLIYESTRGVQNFDVLKAQKMAKIMTMLINFEMPQLIARCKENSIPIDQDISVMRSHLAMAMAQAELTRDQDATQKRLVELDKEKALLQSNKS
jgi:hypothetical protein